MRRFGSIEGWGTHLLMSADPIDVHTVDELVSRMPPAARRDLMEWAATTDVTAYLGSVLARETPVEPSLNPDPRVRLSDDRPLNEYFLLRRLGLNRY